jgi:hypothetical protein
MVVGRPAYTAWHERKGRQDWALQEGDCITSSYLEARGI